MAAKHCTRCGELKPLSEFHVRRASKDGLTPNCKVCNTIRVQEWYAKNLARKKEYDKEYQQRPSTQAVKRAYTERTRAEAIVRAKAWYEANKERAAEIHRKHYEKADKELLRAKNRNWKKANPGRVNADTAKRRAVGHSATPAWCDMKAVKDIYKSVPPRHHVDHIVPLRNKIVCGLHVPWNLRVIPAVENHRKSNRWWPDMPTDPA